MGLGGAESEPQVVTLKSMVTAMASAAATFMFIRTLTQELLPPEFNEYLLSTFRGFLSSFSNNVTIIIHQYHGFVLNEIFDAAEMYLVPTPTTRRLQISKPQNEKLFHITVERGLQGRGPEVVDTFNGVKFKWVSICRHSDHSREVYNPTDMTSTFTSENRWFELTFPYKHKHLAINSYLPHVIAQASNMRQEKTTPRMFTLVKDHSYDDPKWTPPVTLDHPATFHTLAMDSHKKDTILRDLDRFLRRKHYYRKVGKAWKRGYLLYGPPGTGKSSLIAAIANYLKFDVYDLELTQVDTNLELRKLLVATANRSILVVEDIDCTVDFHKKLGIRHRGEAEEASSESESDPKDKSKITLSGLLNFVDGLWSSCGDERIIIFTTNHIEKLDPALLRAGRMDVHIHMSYCTPCGFKLLASNYLGIKEHPLFKEIEELIENGEVTPAEVAEQLMKEDEGRPGACLEGLIDFSTRR